MANQRRMAQECSDYRVVMARIRASPVTQITLRRLEQPCGSMRAVHVPSTRRRRRAG